jgi:hypothetical protein
MATLRGELWHLPVFLGKLKHDWSSLLPVAGGVYLVKTGRPIGRVLGTDPTGILYIGKSLNLQNRVWAFPYGNHSASGFLWQDPTIRMKILNASSASEEDCGTALAGCFTCIAAPVPEPDVDRAEHAVLFAYFRRFGEFPPLNFSAPDRWRSPTAEDVEWAAQGLNIAI